MECPKCSAKNLELRKFCSECGEKLLTTCGQCGAGILASDKFCGECGQKLEPEISIEKVGAAEESERKHVTALFSDLTGYTAMCDRLDPEEVKNIMSSIFGDIAQVVTKYEGFIEKFAGDAVMALFGVPKVHEDDPVRAIKAAQEIHDLVRAMSPKLEAKTGKSLSMHTGINTGLVVTGEVNLEKGTHGVAGETINLAARLSNLSKSGEIVVGPYTYRQAEGYFTFESLEPIKVSGKEESLRIYRVETVKELPRKTHRLSGLRADLIAREAELAQLLEAADGLWRGKGTVFSICGDVGTGKSRLVEKFRTTLDLGSIQWREGHAYPYSQNIPYFPLTDLINRALQIEEREAPEVVRMKIEARIEELIGKSDEVVPYIGSLYALSYPEVEGVSPDVWKSRLHEAVRKVFSAFVQKAPTVICLEDLHWADPSSLELLRFLLSERRYPALFICVYRTPFSFFTSHELSAMGGSYQEIRLQELSASEALKMMESLLKTNTIPVNLRQLIQQKVEGNPFYLEEVINSLIESEELIQDNGSWQLTRTAAEVEIPATIHGLIASRLDRLERMSKRILQEAAVIGRTFPYVILRSISQFAEHIDQCLADLERVDLIWIRSFQPELEYVFKHALTQEVVYEGLLKKERREIHARIAAAMEQLFHQRLSEFYETLAFHFKRSRSIHKAVDYLVKSGEKSWGRYALEEANQHFKDGFEILSSKPAKTKEEEHLLINLLIKWAPVYNHRGDYGGLAKLLAAHEDLAKSLDDKERLGMFYGWLGLALQFREKLKDSYLYLRRALELGEESGSQTVIGYACAWLIITCAELGRLDEAIGFGKRAQETSRLLKSDQILFRFITTGMGVAHYYRGDRKETDEVGKILLDYGQEHSDIRSTALGHVYVGVGYLVAGNLQLAIDSFHKAIQISVDPVFTTYAKLMLGLSSLSCGRIKEAETALDEVMRFGDSFGFDALGTTAKGMMSVVSLMKGRLKQGLRAAEDVLRVCLLNESRVRYALLEYMLGDFYLQIVQGRMPKSPTLLVKNFDFLVTKLPFASKKAEKHFTNAIDAAKQIGAKCFLGQAYLDLGLLHKAKGRKDQAREFISQAAQAFEQCEADLYLTKAREALATLL